MAEEHTFREDADFIRRQVGPAAGLSPRQLDRAAELGALLYRGGSLQASTAARAAVAAVRREGRAR